MDWNWTQNDDDTGTAEYIIGDKKYTFDISKFKTAHDISCMILHARNDVRQRMIENISSKITDTLNNLNTRYDT